MKINDLFFELSHEGRYKILILVSQKKRKHTHIEKELDLTGPEVSRHLKRLQEEKLVQKTVDGYYKITSFGKVICSAFPFYENSLKFVDFINSHNFEPIPPEILFQIGTLTDIELKTTTMENIELWTSLITNSQNYIYAITDQLQTSIIPIIQKRVQSGTELDIKAIITRKLFEKFTKLKNLPPNANQLLKQFDVINNVRLSEGLNMSMIITDLGGIIFLKAGKSIDYSQCIFSRSERFLVWGKKLFNSLWNRTTKVMPSDLVLNRT